MANKLHHINYKKNGDFVLNCNVQNATSPAMKPILTNITLNHESGDIVRETTQAVNGNRCHSKVPSQMSV